MNDIYPVGLTTEDCSVKLTVGWKKPGSFVRQYQGSSHYLTGGSIPPLSIALGLFVYIMMARNVKYNDGQEC